jgi:hypothetical protein
VVVEGRDINRLFFMVENKASSDTCMLSSRDGVALRRKKWRRTARHGTARHCDRTAGVR